MVTQCCNCGASLIDANGELICCCSNCGANYYEENKNGLAKRLKELSVKQEKMILELEKQVCSLELSKKLKELGVPQESLFYYIKSKNMTDFKLIYVKPEENINIETSTELCSTFTVAELGEMLPFGFSSYKRWKYVCLIDMRQSQSYFEADARAKMMIYLLENKLVSLEWIGRDNEI
jgi:hypothetical protein